MILLKRPLTLKFIIPKVGRINEEYVLREVIACGVKEENIKCIQTTLAEAWITMADADSKDRLYATGMKIKGRQVRLMSAELDITTATKMHLSR